MAPAFLPCPPEHTDAAAATAAGVLPNVEQSPGRGGEGGIRLPALDGTDTHTDKHTGAYSVNL